MRSKSILEHISILHHNVNGLNKTKLEFFFQLLQSQKTFIVFLTETWFTDSHRLARKSGYFLCDSTPRASRTVGHLNGGLICLCSKSILPFVSMQDISSDHISIKAFGKTFSTIYLPPSMNISECEKILDSVTNSDIIIGDINTRFGSLYGDPRIGPKNRTALFNESMKFNFNHPVPQGSKCPLDHCFVRFDLNYQLKAYKIPIKSDHPNVLELTLEIKSGNNTEDYHNEYTIKFNTHLLKNIWMKNLFVFSYDSNSELINGIFNEASNSISVDELDEILYDFIQSISESVLGCKNSRTSEFGRSVDPKKMLSTTTNTSAIKIFKQSMKTQRIRIPALSVDSSPLRETYDFFQELYCQPLKTIKKYEIADCSTGYNVTNEEITEEILKYPGGKTCGEDGIDSLIIKSLAQSSNFLNHIKKLFQKCLDSGRTPVRWNSSIIYPIPKNSNPTSISDFRPISLTVIFRRLFEKICLKKIESLDYINLDIGQAGFRSGYSTVTQSIASHFRSYNRKMIRIFLDLKQAYDRTPIPVVLRILESRGLPQGWLSVVKNLYSNCKTRVLVNGAFTEYINLERGLLQGGILSPLLFSIFIDPLANALNSNFPDTEFPALLFADDIQLVHHSPDIINESLSIIRIWTEINGMEINIKKCGNISDFQFKFGDQPIPNVESYKYLGFPHERDGINIEESISLRVNNTKKLLNICHSNGHSWPIWTKLIIFKCFLRPTLEYGLGLIYKLLSKRDLKKLQPIESIYKDCVTWISNVSKRFHKTACFLLGIENFKLRLESLACYLARHLNNTDTSNHINSLFIKSKNDLFKYDKLERIFHNHLLICWNKSTEKGSLSLFLKRYFMKQLEKELPKIGKSILHSNRRPKNIGPIKEIFLKNSDIARVIFAWRANVFASRMGCVCGFPFNRGHMIKCLGIYPEEINSLLNENNVLLAMNWLLKLKEKLK